MFHHSDKLRMHTENLIVGLGIAGINLCHRLEREGRTFVVLDPCPTQSSSLIAGGIYNPIVIKRKVKTWKADALFGFLVPHYREMEQVLGSSFLHHDFPILKPISSTHELDEWLAAIDSGAVTPYVTEVVRQRPRRAVPRIGVRPRDHPPLWVPAYGRGHSRLPQPSAEQGNYFGGKT
jgi:glycine/D-amino acid oxidase-like deaminating enzyme